MANAPAPKAPASKAPASKAAAPPKKEKNPPPPDDDDDDLKAQADKGGKSEKKKGGLPLKLIIIVLAAMGVGVGGSMAANKFMGGRSPAPVAESADEGSDDEGGHAAAPPVAPQRASGGGHAAAAEPAAGGHGGAAAGGHGGEALSDWTGPVNVEFKPFIVNLNDLGGRRMLKLTMSIEAESQELSDEINAKMPQIRDAILLLLSSIQSDDISGLDGKQRLKNQMLNRVNPLLTRGKVKNIYLSEIVVQ